MGGHLRAASMMGTIIAQKLLHVVGAAPLTTRDVVVDLRQLHRAHRLRLLHLVRPLHLGHLHRQASASLGIRSYVQVSVSRVREIHAAQTYRYVPPHTVRSRAVPI